MFFANISKKHKKTGIFEKNLLILTKTNFLPNLSKKLKKTPVFEKRQVFIIVPCGTIKAFPPSPNKS